MQRRDDHRDARAIFDKGVARLHHRNVTAIDGASNAGALVATAARRVAGWSRIGVGAQPLFGGEGLRIFANQYQRA